MALHVALTHETRYTYDRLVRMGPQVVRLRPAPHCRTPILSYSLTVEPKLHFINWQQDPFGNFQARLVLPEPTELFSVTVDLVADMAVVNPFDFFVEESATSADFSYEPALRDELGPYLGPEPAGPLLEAYLARLKRTGEQSTIDFLCDLNRRLQGDVRYLIRMEPGVQTPEETLRTRSGSCRDSGWLLVQILRHMGLAARFVSGYLIQLTPDVKALEGPVGAETDFTDLHAWTEVYVPGAGWIGLDPTSGLLAGEGHIPLAATPQPSSAAPISGAHERADVDFAFHMKVTRVRETARVTKPYSEETWRAIEGLGHVIDRRLEKGDVRLTMGGEPTFVAVDDMEGAEWNTAAVGPNKRRYADDLVRRLEARFAKGGLLHHGQGKWYPGEQLPRWAFALYWRTDGEPLWADPKLIAHEAPTRQATIEDAGRLMQSLCDRLDIGGDNALAAYEDAGYFMLVEQKLPLNVEVRSNTLDDPAERKRVIDAFDRGLARPSGYVLPIQVWHTADRGRRWVTERWALRRDKLFLVPGDSPVGFRLPLGSLPALAPVAYPHVSPRDPFAPAPPLPERHVLLQRRRAVALESASTLGGAASEITGAVRTALAIEPRDGRLCVFLPPLVDAEDFAALVAAVEHAATTTGLPVHLEGYTPPDDPRISVIKVTPDPGVIEVNIHPSRTWGETVATTTTLYEEAHLARLGAEKFMLDGRHTGTGGGNHIVLGGRTPADSPFLRRPDLLASIINYWQNHPSLSYLFSGLFIGPTSQAPRVDEGRHEGLYELEIALDTIAGLGHVPPWMIDRVLRNLLIDVTGNTHRAEICIDKLYSPDSASGRLGLVEFRSFEMPPHARMSLAQQLLIRALIAMFWEKPYRQRLVRWGTALHDRFMLPHFVWADFSGVIADLRACDLPVALSWFEPHFEFRFPIYGTVEAGAIGIEFRQALEPWHVLGEEGVSGGTARYVDSSLERLQVRAYGMSDERYVITCNGRRVPLAATATRGESVAGVRYRAWWPPSALHPTISPHVPLVFDVLDTWSGRSIAGCRYHVSHPGGRNFEIFPVNAYEAEGRRLARFEAAGHSAGAMATPPREANPEYPLTLDLRRPV
ncbi:MAG: transglutaminase family protein [Hyphomicrobiaceae bacterium]